MFKYIFIDYYLIFYLRYWSMVLTHGIMGIDWVTLLFLCTKLHCSFLFLWCHTCVFIYLYGTIWNYSSLSSNLLPLVPFTYAHLYDHETITPGLWNTKTIFILHLRVWWWLVLKGYSLMLCDHILYISGCTMLELFLGS